MRLLPIAVLAALLVAPVHATPDQSTRREASTLAVEAPVLATKVDGWVEVGAGGEVVNYQLVTKLSEPLATRVGALARKLSFEPVTVGGRPVVARAFMRLALTASAQPDKSLQIVVDNVTFPKSPSDAVEPDAPADAATLRVAKQSPLQYPDAMLAKGLHARVLVVVQVDPSGAVKDVSVRQSALLRARGSEEQVRNALMQFEAAAMRGISRWRLAVDNPTGRQLTMDELTGLVMVEFAFDDRVRQRPGMWVWETRSARRDASWLDPVVSAAMPGIGDVAGGEALASLATPRLTLRTPLADVAL